MSNRGVNKVTLMGNFGSDPVTNFLGNGDAVVSFTIATSESWTDRSTGEKKEATEWHRVVAYGKTAEIITEYGKKGRSVILFGKLRTRKWNKDGVDHYTTEIVTNEVQFVGGRNDGPAPTGDTPGEIVE